MIQFDKHIFQMGWNQQLVFDLSLDLQLFHQDQKVVATGDMSGKWSGMACLGGWDMGTLKA